MGVLRKLVGKILPARPSPDHPERAGGPEDWRPGDLAECIHSGAWFAGGRIAFYGGPKRSDIRIVETVGISFFSVEGRRIPLLQFARWRPKQFDSRAFRKITPRADALERATGDLIPRTGKSIPVREDA